MTAEGNDRQVADAVILQPAPDNWKHRSAGMKCATCMWYVPKVTFSPGSPPKREIGRCRRRSPTLGGWPIMFDSDWCGDHKLDEEKLDGNA